MILNKNLFNSTIILISLLAISILTLSLSDCFLIWLMMEISNFLFMSLMLSNMANKKMTFFYFIVQTMSSYILITMLSLNFIYSPQTINLLIMLALTFKLNIPPFHSWMMIIINHLNWFLIMIILSIQKIIPFYLLSFNLNSPIPFYFMVILSAIIPPFACLNSMSMKKIFLYSSINQSSWLLMLLLMKNTIWVAYIVTYSVITSILFMFFNYFKMSIYYIHSKYSIQILMMLIMFFNLASLPPFMFMMFKWYNVFFMSHYLINMNFTFFILMMSSLAMVLIYLNMINVYLMTVPLQSTKLSIFYKMFPAPFVPTAIIFSLTLSIFILMV